MGGRLFPQSAPSRLFPQPSPYRSSPSPFHIPTKTGAKTVLVEIWLDSGPVYISQEGVATGGRFYEPRLLSFDPIRREIGYLSNSGGYRQHSFMMQLASPNREWETIIANEPIIDRRVVVRYANIDEPIEEAIEIFTGSITDFGLAGAEVEIVSSDTSFDVFDQPLSASMKLLDSTTFTNIPQSAIYIGKLVPVVYGDWTVYTLATTGNYPLPAYLIDPAIGQANYRYVLCQIRSGDFVGVSPVTSSEVRRYGGAWTGATPTVTTATYNGETMVVLDFAAEQRDTSRPNEIEITWKMKTRADVGSVTPTTVPVTQQFDFLSKWTPGLSSTDFDRSSASTAASRSIGNDSIKEAEVTSDKTPTPNSALVWIGDDPTQTFTDVIRSFSESYMMGVYVTKGGKFGMYFWSHVGVRDSSLGATGLEAPITIDESMDIVAGSYRCENIKDNATEVIRYGGYNHTDRKYAASGLRTNATFLTYLGKKRQQASSAVFHWAHGADNADAFLDLYSPINRMHEFRVPVEWFHDLELTRLINIIQRYAPGSYMRQVLKNAPSAYWRFGEKIGTTAYDSSGNSLNGTFTGGYTLDQIGALAGDSNRAVLLDGTTGYITVPDNDLLDPGDTFTLEAWVKLSALESRILAKDTNGYLLGTDATGTLFLNKYGIALIVASTTALATGIWSHVAVTKAGAAVNLYIDGIDKSGAVANSTIVATASPLNIGRAQSGASTKGSIDEVAIYPTALSATEVWKTYKIGLAKFSPTSLARIVALETDLGPTALDILVKALEVRTAL